MRKSQIIVDINSKNDIVSIAKLQDGAMAVGKPQQFPHAPAIVQLMKGITSVLAGIIQSGKTNLRTSIIVPETVAIRMNEARKYAEAGAEEIATNLYKDWMDTSDDADTYKKAIGDFAQAYAQYYELNGKNHQFVNARQLYRYELEGDLEAVGDTIKLNGSINEELGVAIKTVGNSMENNMLTGTFDVQSRSYRTRSGETVEQKFVLRKVQVLKDGAPTSVNTTQVLSMLDAGEVVPNDAADSANALINALRLRAKNIELGLPHVKVIAKIPTVAADGTLTF